MLTLYYYIFLKFGYILWHNIYGPSWIPHTYTSYYSSIYVTGNIYNSSYIILVYYIAYQHTYISYKNILRAMIKKILNSLILVPIYYIYNIIKKHYTHYTHKL